MAAKKAIKKPAKGKPVKKSAPKAKPAKAAKKPAKKVAKPVKKVAKPVKKAAKKVVAKKIAKPAKKVSKPVKKVVAKKAAKGKAKPAVKAKSKPVAKKAVAKKPVAKKAAPKKVSKPVKKAIAKKAVAKKPVARKPVAKKIAPKKVVAKPVKKVAPAKPAKAVKPVAPKKVAPVAKPVVKAVAKPAPAKKAEAPAKPVAPAAKTPSTPAPAAVSKAQLDRDLDDSETLAPTQPSTNKTSITKTVVKKDPSMADVRYSDKDLKEFEELIQEKLKAAKADMEELKQSLSHEGDNSTDDTAPTFKMMEDGSETMNREELSQLASRQEKFIQNLENALLRIKNKTYGICRVTGKLIPKERLRLVPHATLSIEAKNMQ